MIKTGKYNYSEYVCGLGRVGLGFSFKNSINVELGVSFNEVNCVWEGYIQSDCEIVGTWARLRGERSSRRAAPSERFYSH